MWTYGDHRGEDVMCKFVPVGGQFRNRATGGAVRVVAAPQKVEIKKNNDATERFWTGRSSVDARGPQKRDRKDSVAVGGFR